MKLWRTVVLLMFIVLLVIPTVSAQQPAQNGELEQQSVEISLSSKLKIKKYTDGRVEGLSNAKDLTEAEIDSVLTQMNMTKEEVSEVPLELKKQFVSRGGKRVNGDIKVKSFYTSLDGIRYEITEKNKEEIQKIKDKDLATIKEKEKKISNKAVSALATNSVVDGKFSAQSYLFFLGSTTTEWKYDYYTSYNWSSAPENYYTDILAQSWQFHTTSVARNGANNYKLFCDVSNWNQESMDITPKPGGTAGEIDLQHACNQYGALHDEVRILKTSAPSGSTGQFVSGYAHPWVGGIVGVALNYLGIDFSALVGDEWFLEYNFTIGS